MNRKTVVIIGGGMAGLVAARMLIANFNVILLEASSEFGGRIKTLKDSNFSCAVEEGAEFVHGEAHETMQLLKEADLKLSEADGTFYKKNQDELLPQIGMIEGWDDFLHLLCSAKEDHTLGHFLDANYGAEQHIELRRQAVDFAEGFDLADVDKVSAKSLYQEWVNTGNDYRINGGYGKLIDYLVNDCKLKGCQLFTNVPVEDLFWTFQSVQVITANTREVYNADFSLITASLGALHHQSGINFHPPIPHYIDHLKNIGFGTVIKVVLEFEYIFWKDDAGFIFSEEVIPTWWTQLPAQFPILTGWKGGPEVLNLKDHSEEQLLNIALNSVSSIFNISIDELRHHLVASKVFNWQNEPYVYGAYSYATTETAAALVVLNKSIEDTIFFAGEGYYSGLHPGTVEAAIVSAKETAERLNRLVD
jgi:monoamine oxidase